MPVSNVEDKLNEGQVWIVEAHLPDKVIKRWLIQIGAAPEGEEPGDHGWWRTQLRHGDIDKVGMEVCMKNMQYLSKVPTPASDWTPNLFEHGNYELYYMWLLDKLP